VAGSGSVAARCTALELVRCGLAVVEKLSKFQSFSREFCWVPVNPFQLGEFVQAKTRKIESDWIGAKMTHLNA